MKVLKFGGSSVGTPEAVSLVLQIVSRTHKNGERLAVVCSAMQGITGTLSEMTELAARGEKISDQLRALEEKHYRVARELMELKDQGFVLPVQRQYLGELDELLEGVRALGEASLRTKDRIMS